MATKQVEWLLELVRGAGNRGLPLVHAVTRLEERLSSEGFNDSRALVMHIIRYALDNCLIDKIIDEPESNEESPDLRPIWLLQFLSPEESSVLQQLPPVEKALLKILRESEWDGDIGVLRQSMALERLREQGFDVEFVSHIPERTGTFFGLENEKFVACCHLLSEYERSDDFKAAQKELEEIAEEQAHLIDVRMARGMREEAAREKRNAARREKRAAEKKKTSAKKTPSKKKAE